MATGKTIRNAAPSAPFRTGEHLRNEAEIAAYLEAVLEDGDPRAMPIALRTVADALGGLAPLAERTGLSRETLYRTLSEKGNPRYDTLTSILDAFGLRVSVAPQRRRRASSARRRVA
ncbi:MAG TPA: addiction module antidote protein [Rhodanobacteraceae bacterium]|jgi:probable addiction module antidote protein|nr:addiction module antidote protein [Rhodanobacteraceae bacterium]